MNVLTPPRTVMTDIKKTANLADVGVVLAEETILSMIMGSLSLVPWVLRFHSRRIV